MKKQKKPKKMTVTKAKKEADKWFSLYIRRRDQGQCFTCPKKGEIVEMQDGHYISRNHLNTRYDEQNNHCQCVGCNVFKAGNMPAYTLALMNKYGDDIIKELFARGQKIKAMKVADYQEIIEVYKNKLKNNDLQNM